MIVSAKKSLALSLYSAIPLLLVFVVGTQGWASSPSASCDRAVSVIKALETLLDKPCRFITAEELKGVTKLTIEVTDPLQSKDFAGLASLLELRIKGRRPILSVDVFEELQSLRKLVLSHSEIDQLTDGLFDGLEQLEVLDLSGNNISHLPESIFAHQRSLKQLWLRENGIQSVPSGIFKNTPALEVVDFCFNPIERLEERTFKYTRSLKRVRFCFNRLTSLPDRLFDQVDLKSVTEFSLIGNRLDSATRETLRAKFGIKVELNGPSEQ